MLDTMTFTKVIGGFCGALLIFLLGKWAAETLYHTGHDSHGDDHAVSGYPIEVAEGGSAAEEEAPADFATVFASADAGAGEKVFGKCRACHKLADGENAVGPHLYGVVGRATGAAAGFNYSGALSSATDVWTPEALNAFLENPGGYAPGTTMSFRGLSDVEDRANLIAYLDGTDG